MALAALPSSYTSVNARTQAAWTWETHRDVAHSMAARWRTLSAEYRRAGEDFDADELLADALNAELRGDRYHRRAMDIRAIPISTPAAEAAHQKAA